MEKNIVLLNCASVNKGGSIQACVSFIKYTLKFETPFKWHYILSKSVYDELSSQGIDINSYNGKICNKPPSKNLEQRRWIKSESNKINPKVVFTFFGPAYVEFSSLHLCGVGDGWVTHSNFDSYSSLRNIKEASYLFAQSVYKGLWFRKATHWVMETDASRKGLSKRYRLPINKMNLVSNSCGEQYYRNRVESVDKLTNVSEINILTLSAYYSHKNLEIIPKVAKRVNDALKNKKANFIITVKKNTKNEKSILQIARKFNALEFVRNIGPVKSKDGPSVYKSCHICFLPTFLETFTANYPESMAMGLPIVTSDRDFARDICQNAALYFDPNDDKQAAKCVLEVIENNAIRNKLLTEAENIFNHFPTPEKKGKLYIELLQKIIESS